MNSMVKKNLNSRIDYLYKEGITPLQFDETVVEIMNYLLYIKRSKVWGDGK